MSKLPFIQQPKVFAPDVVIAGRLFSQTANGFVLSLLFEQATNSCRLKARDKSCVFISFKNYNGLLSLLKNYYLIDLWNKNCLNPPPLF